VALDPVVRAAGGLVWRRDAGGALEVVLVHRPAYDDWSFPKGKVKRDESDREAALREVEEETGLSCSLGAEVGESRYVDARGRPKVARFWAMTPVGGTLAPTHEVDEARWFEVEEAFGSLTYDRDRTILGHLLQLGVGAVQEDGN
jgi:8-oxo-dGTP diphosphatase